MSRSVLFFCGIFLVIVACKNSTKKQTGTPPASDSSSLPAVQSGLDAAPLLRQADSLQILYYDDPDGDSVRYTRFFQYTTTKDPQTIKELLASLDQPVEKRNEIKNCRSEGKIYVFDKRQEPIKTIYFSTRCDTCCYLYYIKEGNFYYSALSENCKVRLKENKALSRKP
jgi:hypothetical protein